MSYFGNQIINMMINKIKQNNPKISPYLDEIQNGGNTSEILQRAIHNGDITRQQWMQAKPLLIKYGQQVGINVSEQDIHAIESSFNHQNKNNYNNNISSSNGFRF